MLMELPLWCRSWALGRAGWASPSTVSALSVVGPVTLSTIHPTAALTKP
jgi:hypothetical protein